MKSVFKLILYFARCFFVRNPNNPAAPLLWDLKPGTTLVVHRFGGPAESFVINKVFIKFNKYDWDLDFKAKVDCGNTMKEEIFLSDAGVTPYVWGWNDINVPYLK